MHWLNNKCSYIYIERIILGECLLISSLPGKASKILVESPGLPSHSTYIAKPSLVNLISNDGNLVLYISVLKLVHSSN